MQDSSNEDPQFNRLTQWLDAKFAFNRLDTALISVSSATSVVFTVGITLIGKEIAFYLLPLFFVTWLLPVLSGYFIGAVIRNNVIDRMRGWLYLLAGTPSYLVFPFVALYLPLWGPEQVDPLNFPLSIVAFVVIQCVIVAISVRVSMVIIRTLFSPVIKRSSQETNLSGKCVLLTSIAIVLFTGSVSAYQIWSTFGFLLPLLSVLTIAFVGGIFFEWLALRNTRTRSVKNRGREIREIEDGARGHQSYEVGTQKVSFMDLSGEIQQCTKCIELGLVDSERLNTSEKPCIRFDVWRKWRPDRVRVLFVAESPPPNGYFYELDEAGRPGSLRTEVLKYLRCSIEEFKEDHLLLDAIKCRLNKSKSVKTPLRMRKIARNCASLFLRREIDELKPETIFVLGKTAKEALGQFSEFEELNKYRITDECDKVLSGYRVILCAFPGGQTMMYRNEIEQNFARIRKP